MKGERKRLTHPHPSSLIPLYFLIPPNCCHQYGSRNLRAGARSRFDKFYRVPNNDPWKHGGTGLGLALVKRLAEQLGGTIKVESADLRTTFALKLPIS